MSESNTYKCDPGPQKQVLNKLHGYICGNTQKYITWVKMINVSFMAKIITIPSQKNHYITRRHFVNIRL